MVFIDRGLVKEPVNTAIRRSIKECGARAIANEAQ
jgi:hypothetical protein